jgi:hypothetical protein
VAHLHVAVTSGVSVQRLSDYGRGFDAVNLDAGNVACPAVGKGNSIHAARPFGLRVEKRCRGLLSPGIVELLSPLDAKRSGRDFPRLSIRVTALPARKFRSLQRLEHVAESNLRVILSRGLDDTSGIQCSL